ncbi:co-chaperone GroES [bacterium]|nr:co-chaperone GroES [bacterium]
MSQINYAPLGDRVIVEPQSAEQVTKFGVYIPDTAQEKPQTGVVVAVGPGRFAEDGKHIPMTVKEGDVVLFAKYGGTEIKIDSQPYLIVRENDVLAVKKG